MYDCWLSKCRVAKVSNRCTKNNQTKRLDWLSWFVSVSQINYLSNHRSRSDRSKATLPGKRSIIRGYNCAWVELYFTFRRYYGHQLLWLKGSDSVLYLTNNYYYKLQYCMWDSSSLCRILRKTYFHLYLFTSDLSNRNISLNQMMPLLKYLVPSCYLYVFSCILLRWSFARKCENTERIYCLFNTAEWTVQVAKLTDSSNWWLAETGNRIVETFQK